MEYPNIIKVKTKKQFQAFVCSFLGRRDMYNESGFPFFIDDKIFFVAVIKNKPVGIAGIKVEKKKNILCNGFVEKPYRGKGIFDMLFKERLNHCSGIIKGVATKASKGTYPRYEFYATRETKNYTFFEKEI